MGLSATKSFLLFSVPVSFDYGKAFYVTVYNMGFNNEIYVQFNNQVMQNGN